MSTGYNLLTAKHSRHSLLQILYTSLTKRSRMRIRTQTYWRRVVRASPTMILDFASNISAYPHMYDVVRRYLLRRGRGSELPLWKVCFASITAHPFKKQREGPTDDCLFRQFIANSRERERRRCNAQANCSESISLIPKHQPGRGEGIAIHENFVGPFTFGLPFGKLYASERGYAGYEEPPVVRPVFAWHRGSSRSTAPSFRVG